VHLGGGSRRVRLTFLNSAYAPGVLSMEYELHTLLLRKDFILALNWPPGSRNRS
jgi:hypothetical protein